MTSSLLQNLKIQILRSPLKFVLTACCISLIGKFILDAMISTFLTESTPTDSLSQMHSAPQYMAMILKAGFLGPAFETLLMAIIFKFLQLIIDRDILLILISALIWGIAHGLEDIGWGIVAFWSFIVMSFTYLHWLKSSFKLAFMTTFSLHAIGNMAVITAVLYFNLINQSA
jgi:hypothetical protein